MHTFICLPKNIKDYKTIDGLHLTDEESKTYFNYFKEETIKALN